MNNLENPNPDEHPWTNLGPDEFGDNGPMGYVPLSTKEKKGLPVPEHCDLTRAAIGTATTDTQS